MSVAVASIGAADLLSASNQPARLISQHWNRTVASDDLAMPARHRPCDLHASVLCSQARSALSASRRRHRHGFCGPDNKIRANVLSAKPIEKITVSLHRET